MSQVPLAPPPQTGGPIDSWLYLLWRRLTQAGQILWASITPGTSADVAAVVTDETGSPGSLVFSTNPTLTGCTVSGAAFTSRGITDNATATALTIDNTGAVFTGLTSATFSNQVSIGNTGGATNRFYMVHFRGATATPNNAMSFASSRGAEGVYTAVQNNDSLGEVIFGGANGSAWAFNKVAFTAFASENWTSTANGAHFALWVTPVGTVSRNVAFTILNDSSTYLGGAVAAPALKVIPVASQARWVEVTGATSSGNPTIGVSGGILAVAASVSITGVVSTSGYTVGTLPAGTVGQRAYVTDALAPAYAAAVVGGGAVTVPVFYNGAAWICA